MGSRLKEEEKNEKAIRNLLRKPTNRRCINCNSLGPQYVCLNFWTFVCTQCSGIHREFTHRVKSVSMSKFTSQEVANLESGGNERGREIHFKDWDSQRQPLPDSSNVDRLREFMKMVYVEKRFTGERPLPRGRGGDREEAYESRRPDSRANHQSDSRSPPYEDRHDDRGHRPYYGQEDRRYDDRGKRFDEKRSPGRFDNRFDRGYNENRRYEDKYRNDSENRRYEDKYRNDSENRRYEDKYRNDSENRRYEDTYRNDNRDRHYDNGYNDGFVNRRSNDRLENGRGVRDRNGSSPPPIRSVKEILGEDVPKLRVEDGQVNGNGRESDRSNHSQDGRGQRFGSSSSFGSVDGIAQVASSIKRENSSSLIDFLAEPEASIPPQPTSDLFGSTPAVQPPVSTSNSTGWATFDMFTATPATGPPAPLTGPASSAAGMVLPTPSQTSILDVSEGLKNPSSQLNGGGGEPWAMQWPAMAPAPTSTSTSSLPSSSSEPSWSTLVGPNVGNVAGSQPWSPFPAVSVETKPLATTDSQGAIFSGAVLMQSVAPPKNASRQEIPQDIFAVPQSGLQFPQMGLQFPGPSFSTPYAPLGGMGMQAGNAGQSSKSSNPFDAPGDSLIGPPAGEFPGLGSLQSALPSLNMVSMPFPGTGQSALGHQWSHINTMGPVASFPHAALAPMGAGLYGSQTIPNALPQTMQQGGVSALGGSFLTASKPDSESFFPLQNTPQTSSQSPFGAGPGLYSGQGSSTQTPIQNPVAGPPVSDALFPGQPAERLISYGSLGSLSSMSGMEPFFPVQPPPEGGQRLLSQGSLGSLPSMPWPDPNFAHQTTPHFPAPSSLGSGNPFG